MSPKYEEKEEIVTEMENKKNGEVIQWRQRCDFQRESLFFDIGYEKKVYDIDIV